MPKLWLGAAKRFVDDFFWSRWRFKISVFDLVSVGRGERIDEIERIVTEWTARLERDEVLARCLEGGAPCAPINSIADIFADPQVAARGNLARVRDERAGEVVVPSVVPRLTATPGAIDSLGPALGAHNREVYGGLLGLDEREISGLESEGVI